MGSRAVLSLLLDNRVQYVLAFAQCFGLLLGQLFEGGRENSHLGTTPCGALGGTPGELPSMASDYFMFVYCLFVRDTQHEGIRKEKGNNEYKEG